MDNNSNSPSIIDYIDKLLAERGLGEVEEEVKAEVREDLLQRVQNAINMTLVKNLPAEKLDEANELLDSNDDAKIQEFFVKNIPNISEVIAAELLSFRARYLAPVSSVGAN